MTELDSLREIVLFSRLSDQALASIVNRLRTRQLADEEVLFNQGDPGNELFIVQSGSIAIYSPTDKNAAEGRPIRIFRRGESLGEMALIDRQPRSLSARALEPTQVIILDGDDFRQLLQDFPEMSLAVMQSLNDRIRYTTNFLTEVRDWVKRMAAGKYQTTEFLGEMQGWVRQVTEGRYDQAIPTPVKYQDPTLASLAADFAQMAAQVQQRENALRQEIAQLKIEIDEVKQKRQVAEIVESEYFQSLKAQVKTLRQRYKEPDQAGDT